MTTFNLPDDWWNNDEPIKIRLYTGEQAEAAGLTGQPSEEWGTVTHTFLPAEPEVGELEGIQVDTEDGPLCWTPEHGWERGSIVLRLTGEDDE